MLNDFIIWKIGFDFFWKI